VETSNFDKSKRNEIQYLFCQSRYPLTGFMHSSVCQLFRCRCILPLNGTLSIER